MKKTIAIAKMIRKQGTPSPKIIKPKKGGGYQRRTKFKKSHNND